jgi:predicted Zn-dependent protease
MGRDAEKQADLEGVGILYNAGYDPRGMPQFFETIEAKTGKGGAQFLSDHPNPGNRTEYVNQEIATFPPRDRYVINTDQFRHIQKVVAGMRAYTSQQVADGAWKHKRPKTPIGQPEQ